MNRSRIVLASMLALVATVLLAGCSLFVTHRTTGIDASDVAKIEFYEYTWGEDADTVDRLTITSTAEDRETVDEMVDMFTDMPTTPLSNDDAARASGAEALGVRYTLNDGTTTEITRIFLGYHDVIVVWPDGDAVHTAWGAPDLVDYYAKFVGTVEEVDADEIPAAALPEGR